MRCGTAAAPARHTAATPHSGSCLRISTHCKHARDWQKNLSQGAKAMFLGVATTPCSASSHCTALRDSVTPYKPSAAHGKHHQIRQGGPAHVPNQGACPAKVAKADASAPWNSTVGPLLAILARSLIRPSLPSTCRNNICGVLAACHSTYPSTIAQQSQTSKTEALKGSTSVLFDAAAPNMTTMFALIGC